MLADKFQSLQDEVRFYLFFIFKYKKIAVQYGGLLEMFITIISKSGYIICIIQLKSVEPRCNWGGGGVITINIEY